MLEFFKNIASLIHMVIDSITKTAGYIDSLTFDSTAFADWLGYARYCMGDALYILFSTVVLIVIGVTIWLWLLKGINLIRSLLP